jgi:hypothetical protein
LLQFTAKELLARGGAGMAGGEVEGQRGQRVDHAVAAHLLPVHGFHADDADDDLDGTRYSLAARSSVARFACQKATPARIRIGSMKRLR